MRALFEKFKTEIETLQKTHTKETEERRWIDTSGYEEYDDYYIDKWGGYDNGTTTTWVESGHWQHYTKTHFNELAFIDDVKHLTQQQKYNPLKSYLPIGTWNRTITEIQSKLKEYNISLKPSSAHHLENKIQEFSDLEKTYKTAANEKRDKIDSLQHETKQKKERYDEKCRKLISFTKEDKKRDWESTKSRNDSKISALRREIKEIDKKNSPKAKEMERKIKAVKGLQSNIENLISDIKNKLLNQADIYQHEDERRNLTGTSIRQYTPAALRKNTGMQVSTFGSGVKVEHSQWHTSYPSGTKKSEFKSVTLKKK